MGVADEVFRVPRRVDHWADDPEGAGVQKLHNDTGLEPRRPRHGRRVGRRDRLEHRQRRQVVIETVLEIDGH